MNPQYSDEYIGHFYSTYIRDESNVEEELIQSHGNCLSVVEQIKPDRGTLLDIGAGNGYLLQIARERGWTPTGQEIDCESAKG